MRIRTKSTLLFLGLSLIPLMLMGKFAYENGKSAIKENLGLAFQQLAHTQLENIEMRLEDIYNDVERWSKMSIMQEVVIGDPDATIQSFLMDIRRENKEFTYLIVTDPEGRVVASTLPEMMGKGFPGYPPKPSGQYVKTGKPHVSDVHYSGISKAWEVTFSFPIEAKFAPGQVIGSILAGWGAINLSRGGPSATEMPGKGDENNHFMLMRRDGLVIAADRSQKDIFKVNLLEHGLRSALWASQRKEGYLIEQDDHGVESLIGYDYAKGHNNLPNLGWSGFVVACTDTAFAAIERLKFVTFSTGLMVISIVIILSLIASGRMTTPLLNITQAAEKVAKGDFQARVVVTSKDEFGQMAAAFNTMAEDLQKTTVSKTYFESIIITANDAFISMDEEGSITGWNPAAERAFGWSRQEAVGKPMAQMIIPPQYRDAHLKGLSRFIGTGEGPVIGKTLDLSALHRDGHEFPVEITVWALRRNGKYQFNAFVRDVSERASSQKKLEAILEGAPDALVIVNDKREITLVNTQAEKMFGYSRAELLGKTPEIFLPEHQRSRHVRQCQDFSKEACARPMGEGLDLFGITKDGRKIPLEISLGTVKTARESLAIVTIRDITERKARENELREAHKELTEKEKALRQTFNDLNKVHDRLKEAQNQLVQSEKLASIGQLAAGVAHEINNPVGFINNNMEILEQYIAGYTKIARLAGQIKESVDRGDLAKAKTTAGELAALEKEINLDYVLGDTTNLLRHNRAGIERIQKIVMDLRTFAREDKDEMEHVKVEEVIEGILTIVQSEIKYKAKLEKNYGDTPPVECNPQRLGQVFLNLIVNALHAIEGTGTIEIKTYTQDKFVRIDVRDTGKGIEEKNLAKVFDPFFTTKPIGQGTGLGLSVSHEIVKKHGGEIKVESQIGSGTTFTVMLPISKEKEL